MAEAGMRDDSEVRDNLVNVLIFTCTRPGIYTVNGTLGSG